MTRLYIFLWILLATVIVQPASPVEIPQNSMIAVHPTTRHLYIATDNSLLHLTANFTVLGNVPLQLLTGRPNGYKPNAIGIDEHRGTLLACWSYNGGLCAQFNSTDIEDKQWYVSHNSECRLKPRSCLVFLGNNTVLVGSSVNKNTGQTAILSLRKLSPDPLKMTYTKGNEQDSSIVMIKRGCQHNVEVMSGFKFNNYAYFLAKQTNPEDKRVNTLLIRVNGNGRTIFRVKEISIGCFENSSPGNYQVTSDSVYASCGEQPFDPSVAMTFCGYKMSTLNHLLDGAPVGKNTLKPTWICSTNSKYSQRTSINHSCADSETARPLSPEDQVILQLKFVPTGNALERDSETLLVARDGGDRKILSYYSGKFTEDDCRESNRTDEARGPYYWCNDICTDNRSQCLDVRHKRASSCEDCGSLRAYENYTCEECINHNTTLLPLYWCAGRCTTTRQCNQTCIFDGFEPRRGPTAAGRNITLHGCGLNDKSIRVVFGITRCILINSTNSTYICKLDERLGSVNDGKKHFLPDKDQLQYLIAERYFRCKDFEYTFENDPKIIDINPKKLYQRGNAILTVSGKGFDLFNAASMVIGYNGTNTSRTSCNMRSGKLMYCPTLPVKAGEEPVNVTLYFQLENVEITLYIPLYDTPSFTDQAHQEVHTLKGQILTISGKFDGVQKEDIHVTVASTECRYVDITANNTILVCGIDWDKLRDKRISGKQTVFVSIKDVGNVTFRVNINLGERKPVFTKEVFIGVIASGALNVCACLGLGCFCCWRVKKKSREIRMYEAPASTSLEDHTYEEMATHTTYDVSS